MAKSRRRTAAAASDHWDILFDEGDDSQVVREANYRKAVKADMKKTTKKVKQKTKARPHMAAA